MSIRGRNSWVAVSGAPSGQTVLDRQVAAQSGESPPQGSRYWRARAHAQTSHGACWLRCRLNELEGEELAELERQVDGECVLQAGARSRS